MGICDKCLCRSCGYEHHSEECQSARHYYDFCETHAKEDMLLDADDINDLLAKLDIINQQEFDHAKDIIEKAISINESKESKYVGTFDSLNGRINVYAYLDRIFLIPVQYRSIRYRVS